jgi:xanthine dehydrogenase accessory factor
MDSTDLSVLNTAAAWVAAGAKATLATVVRTWGSAPRPVGSLLVVRGDGLLAGSVSGGCVEDDLIDRLKGGELAVAKPELLTYGASSEEATRFGLPCGGTLQIVIEPLSARSALPELLAALGRGESITRTLNMHTGAVTLTAGATQPACRFDGSAMSTALGPSWRLLVIGAAQLSRYVADMARALDYAVTVCDPREEYAQSWDLPGVTVARDMPDEVVLAMKLDAHSAVLALTHDPKLDDMALLEALKSPAFYVGALGSKANNDKRRRRLAEFDLSAAEIARLHGPVGLRIGSRTPPEIAIAILAELTAVRHGVSVDSLSPPPA